MGKVSREMKILWKKQKEMLKIKNTPKKKKKKITEQYIQELWENYKRYKYMN